MALVSIEIGPARYAFDARVAQSCTLSEYSRICVFAVSILDPGSMANILFYPAFPDIPSFYDQLYRAIWHFSPMADRITKLVFPYSGTDLAQIDVGECLSPDTPFISDDFDPSIADIGPKFSGRVSVIETPDSYKNLSKIDAILVWNTARSSTVSEAQKLGQQFNAEVVLIDPTTVQQETLDAIRFAYSLWTTDELKKLVEESYFKFERHAARWQGKAISTFGNGPSLGQVVKEGVDLGDTVRAVCNSTICDDEALNFLQPELLFCGDPVQHCGVSRYAGQFRKDLAAALSNSDRVLFTQLGYVPYFKSVTPEDCHDRIIGIGNDRRPDFNLDLRSEFLTAATANIFTMLVLPVACTVSTDIQVFGCDGMSFSESTKPWSHAKEDDYMGRMSVTHRVHKGFWQRNYEEEYWSYCRDLSELLNHAEQHGCNIQVRTPSFVPALAKRFVSL
ncbi:MAG: hypothetical protein HOJ91_13125 [Rhodospirillaceae bacterium]|nr:hypothetical protein [Rhodospirillaceae bacterium]